MVPLIFNLCTIVGKNIVGRSDQDWGVFWTPLLQILVAQALVAHTFFLTPLPLPPIHSED